jgi:putative phosphoserine phosphatase / 1-acylglycerol-3-phosphate O-acyltransferase
MNAEMLRGLFAAGLSLLFMTLVAPVFVLTRLFLGRRVCAERLGPWAAGVILRLFGITVDARFESPLADRRVVYISNHSSAVDILVLLQLGLPRSRFFMKRGAWVVPPLAIIAMCVGTFFTVPQKYTDKRRELFARACDKLQKTGDSVYLSPEGTRVTSGGVGPFNKGAFHLAAALQVPMVPLYIEVPRQTNTGKSWVMKRTIVRVHQLPDVDTSEFRPETARKHADDVRSIFQAFESTLAGTTLTTNEERAAA